MTSIGLYLDERGVSDVIGYVLIFSLIVTTVGVVTVVGFQSLDERQADERVNNVERAFDVFANNMKNVYRDGAPSRATEMRLAGGTLRQGDSVNITIEADNGDNVTISPRPLVYRDGTTKIIYVGGAILRTEGDSSVMLKEPPFRTDLPVASFALVDTYHTSGASVRSKTGTVRVTSTAATVNTTVPDSFDDAGAPGYNVTVESPRSDAWERYFDSQDGIETVTRDSDSVRATISAGRVVAPRFPISIQFSD